MFMCGQRIARRLLRPLHEAECSRLRITVN